MSKLIKMIVCVALAAIGPSLFAYNGGYENSIVGNTTMGGVTYAGYGNNTLTAREESGATIAANRYAQCKKLTSVSLANVTSIGNAAFAYSALTSVELPATLTSVGYIAFGGCAGLSSVTINGTGFMTAGYEAKEPFRDCTALKTVTAKCAPPNWDFKAVFPNVTTVKATSANLSAWQAKKYSGVSVSEYVPTYKVTFGKNGGTGGDDSVMATVGQKPKDITPPTRSGYVFDGYWTTTGTGGVQYYYGDGSAARTWDKTANVTLWAKWIAGTPVKVTLGLNGGTGRSYVYAAKGAAMPRIGVPTKSGSTFGGYWTTTGTGGVQYYKADGTGAKNWDKTSATTLWAKWTNKITFGKNGGSGGDGYVTAVQGQNPHEVTPPTRSGYVFDGYWTTTGTGGVQYYYADGSAARAWDKAANVTLWAKWIAGTPVKVTLGLNGGTGRSYVYAAKGAAMPRIGVPTKSGSTFGGYWTTTGTGGVQYYKADGTGAKNWDKTSATTLWAKWSNKITFGKNGGTGGDEYVTAYQGVKPHDITPPTRSGYVFAGYWTTTGTGGVQYYYADGSAARSWDKTANVTLWAKWIAGTPVKVTLGLNGGTGQSYVYAAKGVAMPRIGVPAKSGYTFGGYWTTTGTGGVKYYNADGTSAKNWDKTTATTLWAKWTKTSSNEAPAGASQWRNGVSPLQGGGASGLAADGVSPLESSSGCFRGVFSDGAGTFALLLDEDGSAFFAAWTEGGDWAGECEVDPVCETLVLTFENDQIVLRREGGLLVAE